MSQPSLAISLVMRVLPAVCVSVGLLTGCQALQKRPVAETAAATPVTTADTSLEAPRVDDELATARSQSPGASGAERALRDTERMKARDPDPVALWTSNFSTTEQDLYHLPPRPGDETFYRPGYARGSATPIFGSSPLFGPDEGEVIASPVRFDGSAPPSEDVPTFAECGDTSSDEARPRIISFRDDLRQIPSMLWNDNLALYTWPNAIIIGAAAGGAVAIRDNLDHRVRDETAEHPLRWGQGSVVLRQFGEFAYQLPVMTGVYALSVWCEDDKLHEFSKTAFSAYGLSAMYTVAIKGVTNTSRPTNEFQHGHYGFPSYHSSSTFCLAAVIDEYYGWQAGIPAYVLAGLVGWSRIDQREHDLSDVVFGSILGFVIGKTVACAHLEQYSGFRVTPTYDPASGTAGVTVDTRF
jgi:hypothetical protein